MKILGIILAILMLGLSILLSVTATNKSMAASNEISAAMEGVPEAMKAELSKEIPSAGRLKLGGFLGIAAAVAAAGLLAVMFVKKPLVLMVSAAAIAIGIIAAVTYPTVPTGPLDGLAPRPQQFIAVAMALLGAGGAYLASRQRKS